MVISGQLTLKRRPKKANSGSLQLPNLTVHDGNFEPMVEILPVRIKCKICPQKRQNIHLPPPINRGGFQSMSTKKSI